jgi:uncharacterized membrane protein
MIMIIIGVVLIGLGVFLYFNRQNALNRSMDIKYYETSKILDVVDTYKQIAGELGAGNYSGTIVELTGVGRTDNPLIAEHSQKPALYYVATVERKYEVTEQERDNDGNYRTVVRTRTETVSTRTEKVPFYLNDGSGREILVDMEGAKIDTIQSFDRFEPNAPAGYSFSYSSDSKTLGYSYKERMIPNGAKLYVLGEVSDRRGELSIVKPSEKGKQFIVSTKSEEELVKSADSSAQWQLIGGIASAVIGVILIILGIMQ